MARLEILAGWFLLVGTSVLLAQGSGGVEVGKNLPGSFEPFNVNAAVPLSEEPEEATDAKGPTKPKYSSRGKFHSLVTEYDLDPVVLLVARDLDDNAAFRDLISKIDASLDRNKATRLRCFVVFMDSKLDNVIGEDDKRDEWVKKLEKFVDDAKLKRVVVTLAGKNDLASYKLDETMALTAILYRKLRVEAVHPVSMDKLAAVNGPEVKAILADIGTKLGANR